ncbi:hypothetical protein N0V83_008519 [Neocucurbitaria cava]|uniref:ubiquitinyl hydrolase 1 n=1 Tax=Neocucurbitaria cava TaxID=798079 RepID=A0A9W8Y3P1_9PLEO|nr:hypothetical protein N0V83_008519 [Neocucurbitaria cava]
MDTMMKPSFEPKAIPEVGEDLNATEDVVGLAPTTSSAERPASLSPTPRKRALSGHSPEEEPTSKKLKAPPGANIGNSPPSRPPNMAEPAADIVDKETWQGFCEIESDPAYFSVILREMGAQDVTVREVFAMDPEILEMLPQPIYGLILLFNYRQFGNSDQADECPANVWFANQLPAQNSCATLAMINILMNSDTVGIGEHLTQFKEFTSDFTPFQRGEALASFDFVKKIHNSFAKKMDFLESDKYLSYKVKRAQRKKAERQEQLKQKGRRASSTDSAATDDSAEGYTSQAHHFIAFVPVGNEVWKLDGLDAQPTSMGTFDPTKGETWLSAASDTIGAFMAAGEGEGDYGVMALTQSPLHTLRKKACLTINTITAIESRLDALDTDWRAFTTTTDDNGQEQPTSPRLLGIEQHLSLFPISPTMAAQIDAMLLPDLLERRGRLTQELSETAAGILAEMEAQAEEDEKATQRRFDAGPVIQKWLEMLAENGYLEENLERFMPGKKGGSGSGSGGK